MLESSSNLDQILAALQQLQHENANLRNSVQELQAARTVIPHPIMDPSATEPNVSLPDKFDGTRLQLRALLFAFNPDTILMNFDKSGSSARC